jgi:predicted small lipoprotein YifL
MNRTRTLAAALLVAMTACGNNGHSRNPSDEHPTDMSGEPRNLPPEGPPGQTIPIREPTNPVDGSPASVGGAGATSSGAATGGSPVNVQ